MKRKPDGVSGMGNACRDIPRRRRDIAVESWAAVRFVWRDGPIIRVHLEELPDNWVHTLPKWVSRVPIEGFADGFPAFLAGVCGRVRPKGSDRGRFSGALRLARASSPPGLTPLCRLHTGASSPLQTVPLMNSQSSIVPAL